MSSNVAPLGPRAMIIALIKGESSKRSLSVMCFILHHVTNCQTPKVTHKIMMDDKITGYSTELTKTFINLVENTMRSAIPTH